MVSRLRLDAAQPPFTYHSVRSHAQPSYKVLVKSVYRLVLSVLMSGAAKAELTSALPSWKRAYANETSIPLEH
jgi:hypothetical protein